MSSSCLRATLKDWCPERSTGVWRIPLRPSLLRLSEAMDSRKSSSECLSPVSTPVASICSHSIGTLSALKIVLTDSATSAPIPSPGMRVVVYFPPNLVGLKMSDWTVAMERERVEVRRRHRARGAHRCRDILVQCIGLINDEIGPEVDVRAGEEDYCGATEDAASRGLYTANQ